MIRGYLFALDPTPAQVEAFRSHCGAARFAYNWCAARVQANWAQRAAEATYGIPEDQLTPWIGTSFYDLRNAWNAAKPEVAPWHRENSTRAYEAGCANLATALANHRAGQARLPRFKSRHRSALACKFSSGAHMGADRRHVHLPKIGEVRTGESTRKLARKIEAGTARVRSATLSYQRGRWHVSLSVEEPDRPVLHQRGRVLGIDLGITDLAVLSTGEHVPNPRNLDHALTKLRRAQRVCSRRRGPDRRTRMEPSNRWRRAQARVQRLHTQVAAQRRDHLHKLTTQLVREHDVIVIEDLAVKNMLRNHRLARHIAAASWAELRRQLTYKTAWTGKTLVVADRWFASSKTCSGCGAAKAKLALSERTYRCTACGLVIDRDLNAARNLAALAADTGELRREQREGTGRRPPDFGSEATRLPREELGPIKDPTQRCCREVIAR